MGADDIDEKSLDKSRDVGIKDYKPASDDLKSTYTEAVKMFTADNAQRALDYAQGKDRESSSWAVLKNMRMSFIDNGVSILRKKPTSRTEETQNLETESPSGRSYILDEVQLQPNENSPAKDKPSIESGDKGKVTARDERGNPTVIVDSRGGTTHVHYDDQGKPREIDFPDNVYQQKTPEGWVIYDMQQGRSEHLDGEVEVTKQGEIISRARDGSFGEIRHPDGSKVTARGQSIIHTNPDGNPTKIKYPNDRSCDIDYGSDKQPSAIKFSDGEQWRKEDGKWNHYKNGKQVEEKDQSEFKVERDGDIIQSVATQRNDGSPLTEDRVYVRHPDGKTITETFKAGTLSETTLTRDRDIDGPITKIEYGHGRSTELVYKDGQLAEVHGDAGEYKLENGKWQRYETDPITAKLEKSGKPGDTQIKLDQTTGDLEKTSNNGEKIVKSADGTTVFTHADGSMVTQDRNGQLLRVEYPDGSHSQVRLRGGQIQELLFKDGKNYTRNGDHWDVTDGKGNKTEWRGEIIVGCDGPINFTSADGRSETISRDGSTHSFGTEGGPKKETSAYGRSDAHSLTSEASTQPEALGGDWIDKMLDNSVTHIGPPTELTEQLSAITSAESSPELLTQNAVQPRAAEAAEPLPPPTPQPYGLQIPSPDEGLQTRKVVLKPADMNAPKPGDSNKPPEISGNVPPHFEHAPEVLAKSSDPGLASAMLSELSAAGDTSLATIDTTKGADPKSLEQPSAKRASEASGESGVEGRVGERSKDAGVGTLEEPEVKETTINGRKRLTEYKMPDGEAYKIEYDDLGKPKTVTRSDITGLPTTYWKQEDTLELDKEGRVIPDKNGLPKIKPGKWVSHDGKSLDSVDAEPDGSVTVTHGLKGDKGEEMEGIRTRLGINGDFSQEAARTNQKFSQIERKEDGSYVTRNYREKEGEKKEGEVVTSTIGSPISTVYEYKDDNSFGKCKGYELRDDEGHVTKIDTTTDPVKVTKGDRTELYKTVGSDGRNGLILVAQDDSTLQIREDGTQIKRDKAGQVTEIVNSDSETTKFERKPGGTSVTIMDAKGNVVKDTARVVKGPESDGSYVVELEKGQQLDAKGEGTHVLRKADGKEVLLKGIDGPVVQSDADKLADKMEMTGDQRQQLKQDLADIDKLPKEQREKIYASLDKIARNDEHPGDNIKLTDHQRQELVASLAHQIAHPESIKQGAHNSCAAADMEMQMARTHPDRYADMVARLSTEGEYKCPGGMTVYAEKNGDRLDPKSDAYGQRSYTSELFQDAAINAALHPDTYKSMPPGSEGLEPRPPGVRPSNDLGERVTAGRHIYGEEERQDILGEEVIIHEPSPRGTRKWLREEPHGGDRSPPIRNFTGLDAKEQQQAYDQLFPDEKYGEMPIDTKESLEQAYKDNDEQPMKVGIHLKGDRAQTGMGSGAGTEAGNHAVVITKIEDGNVYYDNTAGGIDHSYPNGKGVPIDDFVSAMKGEDDTKTALVRGYKGKNSTTV